LVWSVKCLPDGTIVSGDSAGEIRFWDAKNYSLTQRIQSHLADVLDVAVSADGDTVISGGADQRTVVYRKKEGEKGNKKSRWAEVMHRRYHSHDVKTFAVYETKDISIAVSGGMYLFLSNHSLWLLIHYLQVPMPPPLSCRCANSEKSTTENCPACLRSLS
jgi:U3 small nucleolar RNA-associated protein 4